MPTTLEPSTCFAPIHSTSPRSARSSPKGLKRRFAQRVLLRARYIQTRFAPRALQNPAFCSARVTSKRVSLRARYIQTRFAPRALQNQRAARSQRVSLRARYKIPRFAPRALHPNAFRSACVTSKRVRVTKSARCQSVISTSKNATPYAFRSAFRSACVTSKRVRVTKSARCQSVISTPKNATPYTTIDRHVRSWRY